MASPLYDDIELATFYDFGQKNERHDYAFCLDLAKSAEIVLDLGCGTGDLAIAMATSSHATNQVTAVDPAEGVLQLARAKDGSDRVSWVRDDARGLRLGRAFDMIVLTGHAFQVFLTFADKLACLKTIACHLEPDGLFVFDSRNPEFPASKENTRDRSLRIFSHPVLGAVEAWNQSHYDKSKRILTYVNHYEVLETGQRYAGEERIAYTSQPELAALVDEAGLRVDHWLGDWKGDTFHDSSYDIIPVGGLR
ncbi:MAG: methyltransferase domain-containing protein [Devosiaceae bacterium]